MKPIPVTIVTGFLGAGKTTLLNKIMKNHQDENIVVIVNEYGDMGIDHELVLVNEEERIYQINNGCMCCILRDDLVEMFYGILDAREKEGLAIDRIIIETSGLAEPSPIAQTVLRTPRLSEQLSIDSIITLVDAVNGVKQMHEFVETREQIAYADQAFITKSEEVADDELERVETHIKNINPLIAVEVLNLDTVKFEDVVGLNLFDRASGEIHRVEEDIDAMVERQHEHHHHHGHDHDHDHHHTEVDTLSIVTDKPLDEQKLSTWINLIIGEYGEDLMRYKGIISIHNFDYQVVLQGVNMAFKTEMGRKWSSDIRETKIVMIGRHLQDKKITTLFNEIVLEETK